jgi:hypothetical protein
MMRDSITGYSIFNNNQMMRQLDARPVVLIESDSDLSILGPHLRDELVRCAPAFSKSATLLAAQLHYERGDNWVVAIVDQDLDRAQSGNVVVTSYYDLEAEIFFRQPGRILRYVYSHVVSEGIDHDDAKVRSSFAIERATRMATIVGVMRQHGHRARLGVSMRSFPVGEVIRRDDHGDYVETTAQLAESIARTPGVYAQMERAVRDALSTGTNLERLCSGHDLLMSLCALIGQQTHHRPGARDFARGFHAMADCAVIAELSVYDPLRSWFRTLSDCELWDCSAVA